MNARSAVPIWRPTRRCLKAPRPPIRFRPPSRKANPRQEPGKLRTVRRTPVPDRSGAPDTASSGKRTTEPPHRHQTGTSAPEGVNPQGETELPKETEDYREKALRPFEIPVIAWIILGSVAGVVLLARAHRIPDPQKEQRGPGIPFPS